MFRGSLIVAALALAACARGDNGADAFVGAERCAGCHATEYGAWRTSQHAVAMQPARPGTVLGRFDGARFTSLGVASTFTQRDGRYVVNTEGPDGAPHDYEVRYTFGVYPLQQYLVALSGGRMQPLPLAWDARPAARGGQQWYSLEPTREPPSSDFHWTARTWSWNYMCADCHSTAVRKGYDAQADTFHTTYAAMSVSCEACHGPSSRHAAWAGWPRWLRRLTNRDALPPARLTERRGVSWSVDRTGHLVTRSTPRTSDREVSVCAQCHALRGHVADGYTAGASLFDYYDPSLLRGDSYFPDGQQRSEVYTYGSFLQSRMYSAGVTCADCHEPHGQKLRRPGGRGATRRARSVTARRCTTRARITTTPPGAPARRARRATCPTRRTWRSTRGTTTASACRAPI